MGSDDDTKFDAPAWVNAPTDRKVPDTDEQIEMFVDDFIENNGDVQAWIDLVERLGSVKARAFLKERIMAQDENSIVNWAPVGPPN